MCACVRHHLQGAEGRRLGASADGDTKFTPERAREIASRAL